MATGAAARTARPPRPLPPSPPSRTQVRTVAIDKRPCATPVGSYVTDNPCSAADRRGRTRGRPEVRGLRRARPRIACRNGCLPFGPVVPSTLDTIPRRIAESSATWCGLCVGEERMEGLGGSDHEARSTSGDWANQNVLLNGLTGREEKPGDVPPPLPPG